ncbi:MAG: hypothetical protein AAGD06_23400 [Acidobacteriota bacterium]
MDPKLAPVCGDSMEGWWLDVAPLRVDVAPLWVDVTPLRVDRST